MRDKKIRACGRLGEILVRRAQVRHDQLSDDEGGAAAHVEDLLEQRLVVAERREAGADRRELDAFALHVGAVLGDGGDHRLGSPCLEFPCNRDIGMQVTERADRRQEDAQFTWRAG